MPKDLCGCGHVLEDHNWAGECLVRSGPYGEYCLCEEYDNPATDGEPCDLEDDPDAAQCAHHQLGAGISCPLCGWSATPARIKGDA